jgi:hypothetical protein
MPALAQNPIITINTAATTNDIQRWLKSGDARLIAWGAYFAAQSEDESVVTTMIQLVDRGTIATGSLKGGGSSAGGSNERGAMAYLLDALIRRGEPLSEADVSVLGEVDPVHAVILARRVPLEDRGELLDRWYVADEDRTGYRGLRARVAGMLLAKSPEPGFAAAVVAGLEDHVNIAVGHKWGSPDPPVLQCIGWITYKEQNRPKPTTYVDQMKGWPPMVIYKLAESTGDDGDTSSGDDTSIESGADNLVAAAGGDRITYRRMALGDDQQPCISPRPLSPKTRYHLLVEMVGREGRKKGWSEVNDVSVPWTDERQLKAAILSFIQAEQAKFKAVNEILYAKALMTRNEADSIRPKLAITIFNRGCLDTGCHLPVLPSLASSDPLVSISVSQGNRLSR